jgi:RNA polymerase sigma-70 factor, ECF subfamily
MKAGEAKDEVGRLYDQFGAALYRYALMMLGRHDAAEDAVHQVFLGVLRGPARLQEPEHYLRRAVRNACYTRLRSTGPARVDASAHASRPLLELVPDQGPGQPGREDRLALEAAITRLPPEQREVLHLHVFEGMTFKEVAEATGDPPNTVASRYRYAIEKLKVTFSATTK